MPTFIINDETVKNSYGFRVRNAGIKTERFLRNPVMLDQHSNNNSSVIGRWLNLNKKGTQTLADSEFDLDDPNAKVIAGKVDRGFIKACSMGILFDRDKLQMAPDGSYELTECELLEVSICAVPSNGNAVTLFAPSGEVLSAQEIKLSLSALQNGIPAGTPQTANLAVGYEIADLAIGEGKIFSEQRLEFAQMAAVNPLMARQLLATLPSTIISTVDEYAALPLEQQLAYKKNNPQAYANLFLPANKRVYTPPKPKLVVPVNLCSTLYEYQALTTEQCLAYKEQHPAAYKALFNRVEDDSSIRDKAYSMNLRSSFDYARLTTAKQDQLQREHPEVYNWLFKRR